MSATIIKCPVFLRFLQEGSMEPILAIKTAPHSL